MNYLKMKTIYIWKLKEKIILFLVLVLFCSCIQDDKTPPESGLNNPPYPRLSMWWPDSWNQDKEDLARYNYIGWGNWENQDVLRAIKQINPDQLHFTSVSITETGWWEWEETPLLTAIPDVWFLTQIGSTLVTGLNTTRTKIRVLHTQDINGDPLFEAGDTLACAFESMRLITVDHKNNILIVDRGFSRAATNHAVGERIAAHIEFWPGTWVMNLSTFCPLHDAGHGPEKWTDWALREYLPYFWPDQRDGYLIDRIEDSQSWLVYNGESGRNIDPDCSNRLVDDDYELFDAAWREGIYDFLPKIRDMLDGKPLFGNTFGAYFDLLNGSIWESCPGNWSNTIPENFYDWKDRILGINGYIEVSQKGFIPNFSMVETYELEEYLNDPEINNPFLNHDFVPDYQRMRFGITTALLGNGYYSYEINTNGHGTLGLMWFDEYDNAGESRGYLGFPEDDAFMVLDFGIDGKVYRRNFNHGIVICNPSEREVTVNLGDIYKLINGTQASGINSGEYVSTVTIAPRDGRILLK